MFMRIRYDAQIMRYSTLPLILAMLAGAPAIAQDAAPPPAAVLQDDGLTRHGREVPPLILRHLRERYGEALETENRWNLISELSALVLEIAPSVIPASDVEGKEDQDEQSRPTPVNLRPLFETGEFEESERERARAALEELDRRGLFTLLDQLAASHHIARPPQEGHILWWLLPELGAARQATRACIARLHAAEAAGDHQGALRAFEQAMGLGRVMSHGTTIIEHLVAVSISTLALNHMRLYLDRRESTPAELREIIAVTRRHLPIMPLSFAIEGERLLGLDATEFVYEDPERSPVQMLHVLSKPDEAPMSASAARAWEVLYGRLAPKEEARDFLDQQYQRAIELSRALDRHSVSKAKENERTITDLPRRHMLTGIIMPSFAQTFQHRLSFDAITAGHQIHFALQLHRAERGTFPDTLDALVPAYLDNLPLDPYTGEPFRYRLLVPGEDERGRAYILYSVGLDGVDNGGSVHESGPYMASRPAGAGFDFVINEP
jgi:hypothetical protein